MNINTKKPLWTAFHCWMEQEGPQSTSHQSLLPASRGTDNIAFRVLFTELSPIMYNDEMLLVVAGQCQAAASAEGQLMQGMEQ